ncbi:MAG TPA: tripartite tricarboxylate transporter substrate binding protein [Burkholderiales bacterium]
MRRAKPLCLLFALALAGGSAVAQQFPTQNVRIVVPYPAGGSADFMARDIANGLNKSYNPPVLVENRPGAGGHLGAEQVAKASPDGHTLMLGTISHHGAFKMYKTLRYNPAADLQSVVLIAESFNVLMVREGLPVKSVAELIAMARAQPGKLTYASAGSGSATHMAAELFKYMTKVDMLGIPFKGGAPAQVALLGGQVDVNFETAGTATGAIRTGKVRALAVTLPQASPSFPGLPAIAEAVPGYAAVPWYTISGPKGIPADVVRKLNADINAVLKSPELAKRWDTHGVIPLGGTPEDAARRNETEVQRWTAVIEAAKIQVE